MSELIAEARVLVTPDTAAFRQLLTAQVAQASAGVVVPISVAPVVTGGSAAGATAGLVAQQELLGTAAVGTTQAIVAETAALDTLVGTQAGAAAATRGGIVLATQQETALEAVARGQIASAEAARVAAAAAREEAAARRLAAKAAAEQAATFGATTRGAGSAALSMVGLRGATLAATGPFLAGAAAVVAFSKSIQLATSFNTEIATLGAVTGATGEQLEIASDAAKRFGRDITLPGVTANDAAVAITAFAKAGLTMNESIAATRGGLQLAQAAQISYTDAVELSANALNAFNLSGSQAEHVADVLANSANLAQGGIEDTALALRQAAAAAEVVGVSFEDTSALLTLLARNGLTGSDAGTALRTAFLRLVNPSKEANKVLQDLNINLRDAQGNVRPEVFAEFAAAQRNLAVSTQQANAAIVFGQDAFRAFGILGAEGTQGLNDIRNGLDVTGTAAKVAAARMTGLRGATERLSNQLDTLGTTIGQSVTPFLVKMVGHLEKAATAANQAATGVGNLLDGFDDLPGPDSSDFFDSFVSGLEEGLKNLNPQAAQIFKFLEAFGQEAEKEKQEIKNGGVELRDAIENAGRVAAQGALPFQSAVVGALQPAFEGINQALRAGAAKVRAAALASIQGSEGQQSGLEEVFDQIVAGGGSQQQQIANLRRQAAEQEDIIADAGEDAAGVLLEKRRAAQHKLAGINSQIIAIEKGIAADNKAARDEAQRIAEQDARDAAAAFLERQSDARSRAERLVGLADETEGLSDDIKRRQALRVLITQQIAAIRQSALDEEQKAQAIKALATAKQATSDEINKLVRTQAQQNKEQREAAQEEREAALIALGESILDRTGNKNPLLRALDAAIKDAITERNKAKKGSLEFIKAQTEINNLIARKKQINEDIEKESSGAVGGTSLVDLFKENQEIARQAGNVGDFRNLTSAQANQPIRDVVQHQLSINTDPAVARQTDAVTRLTDAINRLNDNLTSGNTTTAGKVGPVENVPWHAMSMQSRFFLQKQANEMVEHGLTGRSGV